MHYNGCRTPRNDQTSDPLTTICRKHHARLLQDPDNADLDNLPTLLATACSARDAYTETAGMANKLCKRSGKKKAPNFEIIHRPIMLKLVLQHLMYIITSYGL